MSAIYGIIDDFKTEVEQKIRQIEKDLGSGKAKSHEDYKRMTGEIKGYRGAGNLLKDIVRRYLREENDNE